jgi:hypothetical protein
MMFVRLRPRMIRLWLSYEMWDIRSVNMVYVDNLGPPGIGKTAKISVEILVDFYLRTVKKKSLVFLRTKS